MAAITRAGWFSVVSRGNNVTKNYGYTALMVAAEKGKEEVVRALIEAGADINARNNGYTALMLAVEKGKEEVARVLIDAGADINVTNDNGYTALMLAVRNGNKEVVRALIDAGADINVTTNDGHTALMLAAVHGKKEVARGFIDLGDFINVTNNAGHTALMLAAERGKKEVARALIDAGADINVTNNDGYTALILAALNGNEEVARALIVAGADVHVTNNDGYNALLLAAKYGREAITRVLIDNGKALVNAKDAYGRTPLFYAITKSLNVARFLLDKGACLHGTDDCNVSVLSFYIEHYLEYHSSYPYPFEASGPGLYATFAFLLEKGLQEEAIVHSVLNVIFRHAVSAYARIIVSPKRDMRLLSHGRISKTVFVDALLVASNYINNKQKKGIIENIVKIFKEDVALDDILKLLDLLIQSGANPNSLDSQGNTALHYATLLPFFGVPQDVVLGICLQLKNIGVKLTLKNHQMETPLLFCLSGRAWNLATKNNRWLEIKTVVEVCQFLLKDSSRLVSDTTRNGESVFHLILALFKEILPMKDAETRGIGLQEAVKLLKLFSPPKVTKGVTVNKTDNNLNSPLHLWASLSLATAEEYTGNVTKDSTFENILQTILKHLLSCGVKLNARNTNEETPLHLCKTWNTFQNDFGYSKVRFPSTFRETFQFFAGYFIHFSKY